MMNKTHFSKIYLATRCLIMGYISFFVFLVMCIIILPEGLFANHGISYFGDNQTTRIPYILTFLIPGLLSLFGVFLLPNKKPLIILRWCLFFSFLLMIGLVFSTRSISPNLNHLHVPLAVTLFILQLALASWLANEIYKDKLNQFMLVVQLIGAIIAYLSLYNLIFILIEGQIIFEFASGFIIIRTLKKRFLSQSPSLE